MIKSTAMNSTALVGTTMILPLILLASTSAWELFVSSMIILNCSTPAWSLMRLSSGVALSMNAYLVVASLGSKSRPRATPWMTRLSSRKSLRTFTLSNADLVSCSVF